MQQISDEVIATAKHYICSHHKKHPEDANFAGCTCSSEYTTEATKHPTPTGQTELPGCITGAYVCEHPSTKKFGVLMAGNTVTYYERHEARKIFAEMASIIKKWDTE